MLLSVTNATFPYPGVCGVFLFGGGCLENWKDIAGYEGLYQVSDAGKVRSLNWRNRGEMKELTLKTNAQGESQVELSKDGKRKTYLVSLLVEVTFPPNAPALKPTGEEILQLALSGTEVKRWADMSQIRKELGFHPGSIYECCKDKHKTAYGFRWRFAV
jgi:hypothetical protein